MRFGPFGRRGEIKVEVVFLGVVDELSMIGEAAAVAVAQVLEDHLTDRAEAGRHLEEFDEILGGQPAGHWLAGRRQDG